ncbi:hypothetical protein BpHYR1_027372 [Brachionus plicatilis]|uniref:Uncharacterized protein n=1 Tax=Brachionus plicatilis TaxID=10195 RepID=A0A3M7PR26_BRAPC|nr:hypothetical protein BpHYR1_027372 [Brachionus plicatilis]
MHQWGNGFYSDLCSSIKLIRRFFYQIPSKTQIKFFEIQRNLNSNLIALSSHIFRVYETLNLKKIHSSLAWMRCCSYSFRFGIFKYFCLVSSSSSLEIWYIFSELI